MITKASFSVCVLVLAFSGAAFSQTTIFNIPAADTLQKSSVNVEADFLTHPVSYRNGGYQTYGYRLAYGVTSKTEIGSNFYLTWDGHHSVADIEFSFKREIYRNEKHGVLSSIGKSPRESAVAVRLATKSEPNRFAGSSPIRPLARFTIKMRSLSIM